MVTNLYDSLLKELSKSLKIEPLEPDENNTCLVRFANGVEVYIEMDAEEKNLILGTNLGEIPIGPYRERIFRAALMENALPFPRFGNFAFSNQSNSLVIFEQLPARDLHGDLVAEIIAPFVKKAHTWKEALEKGEVPIVKHPGESTVPPSGMLGLR